MYMNLDDYINMTNTYVCVYIYTFIHAFNTSHLCKVWPTPLNRRDVKFCMVAGSILRLHTTGEGGWRGMIHWFLHVFATQSGANVWSAMTCFFFQNWFNWFKGVNTKVPWFQIFPRINPFSLWILPQTRFFPSGKLHFHTFHVSLLSQVSFPNLSQSVTSFHIIYLSIYIWYMYVICIHIACISNPKKC